MHGFWQAMMSGGSPELLIVSSCFRLVLKHGLLYSSWSLQPSQNFQNTNALKILQAHKYFNRLLGGTGLACYTVRMPKQMLRENFFFFNKV